MKNKYSTQVEGETAKVLGKDLTISKKHSVEICRFIRKKKLSKAKELLNKVLKKEIAVPYQKHTWNLAHKKSTQGPGRYPLKAVKAILGLVEAVEANAQFKGMNTGNLVIEHINAHQASRPWHFGRQRRRKMKRTHVEIIVKEGVKKKEEIKKPEEKKVEKKEVKKEEIKKVDKK
ncbi:50S ribosomal protein L22 [Candidatus Woesearchaeota archaeon]|nr:50S ribosomal protein L22 [Candidatus Woesearchaeota archaeon]